MSILTAPIVRSPCRIERYSAEAELLLQAKLIIWDEAIMTNKLAFQAVELCLRDITTFGHVPFGGKLFIFGGDFRQTLPIVPRASQDQIVAACINRANFWPRVKCLKLTINMRVQNIEAQGLNSSASQLFSQFLLDIGEGKIVEEVVDQKKVIRLPQELGLPKEEDNLDGLIKFVYGEKDWENLDWLSNRAILAPTNAHVRMINERMMEELPRMIVRVGRSADRVISDPSDDDDVFNIPLEMLHSTTPSGMPDHEIPLKVGMPLILFRNVNGSKGQVNGTRLILRHVSPHILDVEIASGQQKGDRVFLPRIRLSPPDSALCFKFERLQFPVKAAFALTIDKSQGQTLNKIGLYLQSSVF